MLVLARRVGESFKIGPDITIKIVRNGESLVRVGIEAPKHMNIVRTELITNQGEQNGNSRG